MQQNLNGISLSIYTLSVKKAVDKCIISNLRVAISSNEN